MSTAELHLSPGTLALSQGGRSRGALVAAAWVLAGALPLVGLVSLLLREQLDLNWHNHQVHFTLFLTVGVGVFLLAFAAGDAANRRGDARVLLISLAFLSTGGFLGLHALGTTGVLFTHEYAGFKIANPVVSFSQRSSPSPRRSSTYAPVRPARGATPRGVAPCGAGRYGRLVRLDGARAAAARRPGSEGGSRSVLAAIAAVGVVVYAVAAARYWLVYRGRIGLLQASVIACFVLLAEAMVGVALTGERTWHASWWEWHAPHRHGLLAWSASPPTASGATSVSAGSTWPPRASVRSR